MNKLFFFLVFASAGFARADSGILNTRTELQGILEGSQKSKGVIPLKIQAFSVNIAPVLPQETFKNPELERKEAEWRKENQRRAKWEKIGSGMMVLGTLGVAVTLGIGFMTGAGIAAPLIAFFVIGVTGYYLWPNNVRHKR